MNSIEPFLNRFFANADTVQEPQQLEQFVASMARERRLETAPVCADLALSLMCSVPARSHPKA